MKQKILSLNICFLVLTGFTLIQSCEKTECPNCLEEPDLKTLFDTLKGEWTWIFTKNYAGTAQPLFTSTVHFLSMNQDSSINYVTFKEDTIKKYGRFSETESVWYRKIVPDILLHYNRHDENLFQFRTKDTLIFSEYIEDGDYYYYIRVTK
ncbi:MAG: hypothetical protein R6V04_00050 [bacterium]